MGKSSSRKLRRVIYYTFYRMDPKKTYYVLCLHNNIKNRKIGKNALYTPPDQPPFKGGLLKFESVRRGTGRKPLTPTLLPCRALGGNR